VDEPTKKRKLSLSGSDGAHITGDEQDKDDLTSEATRNFEQHD
jgi:hypothetical protein